MNTSNDLLAFEPFFYLGLELFSRERDMEGFYFTIETRLGLKWDGQNWINAY